MKNKIKPSTLIFSYSRVSSDEQFKEGFSISSQTKLIKKYANEHDFIIDEEFVDIESAKKAGRTNFGVMVGKFQQMKRRFDEPPKMILLCEKTDRLYRNIRDWVIIDDLDIEIHFVKENQILSKDSKSSEKFVHGIKVLMAKSYVDNLSEETRKGMLEKAEQGHFPMGAPLGYSNVRRHGKSVIEPDSNAPLVTQMFHMYASGEHSLKTVQEEMIKQGLNGRNGAPLTNSTVHNILRNPIFYGAFRYKGHLYLGKHEPLISKEVLDLCQETMAKRFQGMKKKRKHEFVYQGLITCGDCGCILTAEIKKEKYIYYHCSNGRKKCQKKIYFAEHKLDKQFNEILPNIDLPDDLYDQTVQALKDANHQIHDHQLQRRKELEAEYLSLKEKKKLIYDDRLERRISAQHYEDSKAKFNLELGLIHKKMEMLEKASFNCLEDGLKILELAKNANIAYKMGNIETRKQLLRILLSNCKMEGRTIKAEW